MKTMKVRPLVAALIFAMVLSHIAIRQICADELATLTGRITDSQGLVLPGVKVEAININTNVGYSGDTNGDGLYRISELPPGRYRVIVQKNGFAQIVKPGVEFHVQDTIALNFSMRLGSVSESITVEGGTPLVNTESSSVGTVIDREFVGQLPLNGRSFNTLLQLTPGVVIAPTSGFSPGQFSINGQRTNSNSFSVDGVSVNFGISSSGILGQSGAGGSQAFNAFGGTSSLVSVDAVQEFRVQTSTFAPEYGRTPGGQVIIETRSGTNDLHGGLFDYFRNDVLDANDWFANALPGSPHAAERQNDFGVFAGGPVLKNKTFFFFSYEGLRLRLPQTQVIRVPSLSVRASAIPSAAPYLNAYPKPNGADNGDGTAQFTANFSNQAVMDATSLRIDHHFGNNKWSLFGRYNYSPSELIGRSVGTELDTTNTDTTTATLGLTGPLTSRIANSLRVNYSLQTAGLIATLDSFGGAVPPSTSLLIPPPLTASSAQAFFLTFDTSAYLIGQNSKNHVTQVNVVDDLALSKGSHQFKLGIDYRELDFRQAELSGDFILIASTAQKFASSSQVDFADNFVFRRAKVRFRAFSFYAQDTWNVRTRVALNFGVRWELNPSPSGYDGTTLAAWTNVDNPPATALAPAGSSPWKTTFGNLAPRLGAAYRVTEKGDFVVRGGWGVFYDLGTSMAPSLAKAFPNSGEFFFNQPTTLPIASAAPFTPVLSAQPPYGGGSAGVILGFTPNLKLPFSYQWNVAVEKSFMQSNVASVTYVGQTGRNLIRNEGEPQPNSTFAAGSIFQILRNGSTSDYHALQVQFRRPLSHRAHALLNYTWGHSIDTSSTDSVATAFHGVLTASTDRGSSDFDVRHSFSGAVIYELPRVGRFRLFKVLTRDWSLDTVVQARTGFPVNVTTTSVVIPGLPPGTPIRPDLRPNVPVWLYGSNCAVVLNIPTCPGGQGLNPNAFDISAPAAAHRQGTLGRNAISGFGFTQADLSIARKFPFTERVDLRFRVDLFNVFNHPNFANPNAVVDDGSFFSTQMLNQGLGGLSPLYQQGGPRSVQISLKLQF